MSFKERAEVTENKLSRQLLSLMEEKKSNLAVSVDLTLSHDILQVRNKPFSFVVLPFQDTNSEVQLLFLWRFSLSTQE